MNWKRFWSNPYKWGLWHWIGGRPWTYIWRDIYHRTPIVIQVLWFFIGVGVYHFFGWWGILFWWVIYLFGFLEGHFHWGKKYEPNQQGE